MSFLITRKPEKLFAGSTKFSRWTALWNPYIFEFTRADYEAVNIMIRPAYHATLPTILTDAIILPTLLFAGDQIYVNSGGYVGLYTVESVTNEYIVIDTPFIGNAVGGRVNLVDRFINYRAFVKIYDAITDELIDTLYPKPDSTGLLLCDVSGVIRSRVVTSTIINQAPSNPNIGNRGLSGSFKIGYGATFTISLPSGNTPFILPETPATPDENTEPYYWVSAARQITGASPDIDGIGQNMKEYVPKNLSGSAAKFLTMFEKPTYFQGFPFFLSFIYDDDFSTVYLDRHQQSVDVNGNNVGAPTVATLSVSEIGYVNQMRVNAPNTGSAGFDVWLETGSTVVGGYVEPGGIPEGASSEYANPH